MSLKGLAPAQAGHSSGLNGRDLTLRKLKRRLTDTCSVR